MPLITPIPVSSIDNPSTIEEYHDAVSVQTQHPKDLKDEKDSGYENDEECQDSDMEGSILDRPRPKKKAKTVPPVIPQRNERRASKMLDTMLLELSNLDGSTTKDSRRTSTVVEDNPHDMYLSSEEDASLSDDYEDSLLDADLDDLTDGESASRPSSRKSQEDTARVVSFIMVGKPQIVEIIVHSPTSSSKDRDSGDMDAVSSAPSKLSKLQSRRPSALKLFPLQTNRRMSIASVASTSTTSTASHPPLPAPTHSTSYIASRPSTSHSPSKSVASELPPRKSSRLVGGLANLKSSLSSHARTNTAHSINLYNNPTATASYSAVPTQSAAQHSFLHMDPFEAAHYQSPTTEDQTPATPKTPTGMSSAAWKTMGQKSRDGVMRSLSKARKGSMPKLNLAYTAGALGPRQQANESRVSLALTQSIDNASVYEGQHQHPDELDRQKMLQRRSATMPMQLLQNEETPRGSGMGDMLRKVVTKAQQPASHDGPSKRAMIMGGLGRKKSLKS